jgi:hypothetical protein
MHTHSNIVSVWLPLQAPGLLSATAAAAFMMAAHQHGVAAAVAPAAATAALLNKMTLVSHLLQLGQKAWPSFSRLLCGELTAAEEAAMVAAAGPVWTQHQKYQQQLQQQRQIEGRSKECAQSVRAAAGLVLLGNSSILLQQLLRAAAAAVRNNQLLQQLWVAVLYCADSLGDQIGGVWADVWLRGPERQIADGSVPWQNQIRVIAHAVQAFEAAVRHVAGAVPGRDAAGSTLPASSGGNSNGGRRLPCPPSIIQVELAAGRIYTAMIDCASEAGSSRSCSSCSSTPSAGLHRAEQQLLQAVLVMLLTSAKLRHWGLQPPLSVELLWKLAETASACVKPAEASHPAASTPDTPAAARAAAPTAAIEAAGGAQVCHLVSRYLSCLEQQLRGWVASGDGHAASCWLAAAANQDISPLAWDAHMKRASAAAAAAAPPHTHLQALALTVQASCAIARACSGDTSDGLGVQRGADCIARVNEHIQAAQLQISQAGKKISNSGSQPEWCHQQVLKALLVELLGLLYVLAEVIESFGSALAASLPSRFGCNWPGCVRLSGVSEGYGLVRGQACVCGGCRHAR